MSASSDHSRRLTASEQAVIDALRRADPEPGAADRTPVDQLDPAALATEVHAVLKRLIEQDLNKRLLPHYAREASPLMGVDIGEIRVRIEHLGLTGIHAPDIKAVAPPLDLKLLERLRAAGGDLNLQSAHGLLELFGRLARAAGVAFSRPQYDWLLRAMRVDYSRPGAVIERGIADGVIERRERGSFWAAQDRRDVDPGLYFELLEAIRPRGEEASG